MCSFSVLYFFRSPGTCIVFFAAIKQKQLLIVFKYVRYDHFGVSLCPHNVQSVATYVSAPHLRRTPVFPCRLLADEGAAPPA